MILSEMRDSLRRKIGQPTTTDVTDTELNALLNEANRHIADRYPFHMSRTLYEFPTVAGTKRYALPTDLTTLLMVGNRTNRNRIKRSGNRGQFRTETQDTTVTGAPQFYTRMRDWIQFYPIPDKVYAVSLFYKNSIADMVAGVDESELPITWHPGVVLYARYIFYDERQDYAKAQYAYSAWALWVGDKPNELQEEWQADPDMGIEMPSLRGGDLDDGRRGRGFDFDE